MKIFGLFSAAVLLLSIQGASVEPVIEKSNPILAKFDSADTPERYKLAFDFLDQAGADTPGTDLAAVYRYAMQSLRDEQRWGEYDRLLALAAKHPQSLELLIAMNEEPLGYGRMIDGKFARGEQRGSGPMIDSSEYDRAVNIQRLAQALPLAAQAKPQLRGKFYRTLASALARERTDGQSWRLQELTDLTNLPALGASRGNVLPGVPADRSGTPVYHALPADFQSARSDGERLRWAFRQGALAGDFQSALGWADFVRRLLPFDPPELRSEAITEYQRQLSQLPDEESWLSLPDGRRRIALPDDYNSLKLYTALQKQHPANKEVAERLLEENMSRCRFPAALRCMELCGASPKSREALAGMNGTFDSAPYFAAGREPEITLLYRNAPGAELTLNRIDPKVLSTVWIKHMTEMQQEEVPVINSPFDAAEGFLRLAEFQKIIGPELRKWSVKLTPGGEHFVRTEKIRVPVTQSGLYLLTATLPGGNKTTVLVQLSNLAVAERQTVNGTQFFVTDSRSGAPVEDARLSRITFKTEFATTPDKLKKMKRRSQVKVIRAEGVTGEDGSVTLSTGEQRYGSYLVFAESDDAGAWLTYWGSRAYPQNPREASRAFLISNAPIYKPLQTASFSCLIRKTGYGEKLNPMPEPNSRFTVAIRSPRGTEMWKKECAADESGVIAFDYQLPESAELGLWQVAVTRGKTYLGNGSFRVEEFRKPDFKVSVTMPDKPVKVGTSFTAAIRAEYYFGAPVIGGKATYRVYREDSGVNFEIGGPWSWLYGGNYRICSSAALVLWGPRPSGGSELILQGSGLTDAQGTLLLTIPDSDERGGKGDFRYRIEAEVTDESEHTISASGSVVAARQPLRIGLWSEGGFFRAGAQFKLNIAAHLPDGKPYAGNATIRLYHTRLDRGEIVRTQPAGKLLHVKTAATDGLASLPLLIRKPGVYEAVASMLSPENGEVKSSTLIRIQGDADTSDANLYSAHPLEISCDKPEYRVGEQARVLFSSIHERGTLFVSLRPERCDGKFQIIPLRNHSAELAMTVRAEDRPNTFVSAFLVVDGKFIQAHKELAVPPDQRILNVEVAAGRTMLAPGDQENLTIRVTDSAKRPASGIVTVAVYDEALEYLVGNRQLPEIRQFFWGWKRWFDPRFTENLSNTSFSAANTGEWLMPSPPIPYVLRGKPMPLMAKMSAGANFAAADQAAGGDMAQMFTPEAVPLRSDFRDSLFWAAQCKLNADGTLTLPLTMPDNLTTWKVKVWAITDRAAVGEGAATIMVSKKLIAQLVTPRFLVAGDRAEAFALLHNNTSETLSVKALFDCSGAITAEGDGNAAATVAPGTATRLVWKIAARTSGQGTFTLRAASGTLQDGMTLSIPVLERGAEQLIARSAVVNGKHDAIAWTLPDEFRRESASMNIRLTPSIARSVLELLPYLAGDESRNTFSLPSRWIPALSARNAMLALGVPEERFGKLQFDTAEVEELRKNMYIAYAPVPLADAALLRERAEASLRMLQAMQNADGGWGWFSGTREQSYPDTSCYVLQNLLAAKRVGVAVPPAMLKRGMEWLKSYQQAALKKSGLSNINAWAFEILSANGHFDPEMAEVLMRNRKTALTPYGMSLLALGLHHANKGGECRILLGDLAQYLRRQPENQTAYLECPEAYRYYWYGSDTETQAAYLRLLAAADPASPELAPVAKYLTNNLLYAPWRNSSRTLASGIEALTAYLKAGKETRPDYTYRILWDGKELQSGSVNASNLFDAMPSPTVPAALLTPGEHKLEIIHQGTGTLYVSGALRYFNQSREIAAAGTDLKIHRRYWLLKPGSEYAALPSENGMPTASRRLTWERSELTCQTPLAPGDTVEVELNVDGLNDFDYIAIRDPLPAGLVSETVRSGYLSWYWPIYAEYRTTASEFFIRSLGRGNNQIRYRLRVEFPGLYQALPATARGVYAPELRGNSATQELRVGDESP